MPITYVIAESSVQVLFPLLDILNQILGGVQPYKLEKLQGENAQRFSIFNWLIKKCPVTLIVDNQMDVTAPESNLVMFHRITLGTPRGTLMLTDTHGSVLWTPVFHEDLKKQDKLGCDEIFQIETQEYVNDKPIGNLGDIVTERWPNCMVYVLKKFYQDIVNENYISSENQQLLTVCEIWNKIGELLGIYEKVEIQTERPCKLVNLIK